MNGYRIIIFAILLLIVIPARSQTLDELKGRKEKTRQEIDYTNRLLNETGRDSRASLNKLSLINQKIVLRNNLITDYNTQLNILQNSINDHQFIVTILTEDIERIRYEYAQMIRQAYRNRGNHHLFLFLLSSKNFDQAYKRILHIRQMARYRKKQSEQIDAIRMVLQQKISDLNQRKMEQQEILSQQMEETSKLNLEKQKQTDYYNQLKKREKELKKHLQDQQKMEEKLEKEIQKIIEEEARKLQSQNRSEEDQILSENFEKNKGRFPWPVKSGIITDKFGEHAHPVMKTILIRNSGIDISTQSGEKARSIFNGSVSKVFAIPGGNIAVIVRHGEYITVYSNLKEVFVKEGDRVDTLQEIGTIFSDKHEDNKTILKFQLWKESQKLNPEEWIKK
ncbi:MAG TPA: peptidoglycan DD-metalloendopeptidase family protein [Prolixibacteraceae bacterium]|nr:peptidoglycan DD-metalloendopeptidase family protein [Prolixibacteraceae bacterium]